MRIDKINDLVHQPENPFWLGFFRGLLWASLILYPLIIVGWALYWWAT